MKKKSRVYESVEEKRANVRKLLSIPVEMQNIDMQVELIQLLVPIGILYVRKILENEVTQLVGERYRRSSDYYRWGKQGGSVYLTDQKVPIDVPRVRSKNSSSTAKSRKLLILLNLVF